MRGGSLLKCRFCTVICKQTLHASPLERAFKIRGPTCARDQQVVLLCKPVHPLNVIRMAAKDLLHLQFPKGVEHDGPGPMHI